MEILWTVLQEHITRLETGWKENSLMTNFDIFHLQINVVFLSRKRHFHVAKVMTGPCYIL